MSKYAILARLSRKNIELFLIKEDNVAARAPFSGSAWQPRRFDAEFATQVVSRIEKYLTAIDSDALADTLPVTIIAEPDVDQSALNELKAEMEKRGNVKVTTCRPDSIIAGYYFANQRPQGVVIVASDGRDLWFSLAKASGPTQMVTHHLPGMGEDPRAEALAHKIWNDVRESTIDLREETEWPVLLSAAKDYLASGRAEVEDSIRLSNGNEYEYFVNRSMIDNSNAAGLLTAFTGFLGENGLNDRSRSVVAFRRQAIGNGYITDTLTPGFGSVASVKDNLEDALLRIAMFGAPAPVTPRPEASPEPAAQAPAPIEKAEKPAATFQKINIDAKVETVKAGLFKKKKVLKIKISSDKDDIKLNWHSLLIIQDRPLTTIQQQNIVNEYDRGDRLPFLFEVELPLKQCPNAKALRIYFKPDPNEPVGINSAYETMPVTINI